jgi:ABC-type antimicrobial peptide transport system permease subunit
MKRPDSYSSVILRAKDQNALTALTKRITDDPKFHLKAVSERVFYEDQQGTASGALKGLAVFISFIMAIGAGFAGMNTMYAAVARRTKEIGTLRVLGFSRLSILIAFLLESIAIALIGAAIGIVLSLPLNFVSTGTSNFVTFSEIAFNFRVTADLMLMALVFGGIIGLVGSLLPSIRASRFKIVDALRA